MDQQTNDKPVITRPVCPFKFLSDCSWEGISSHIVDHVIKKHGAKIIKADSGVFPLIFDYSVQSDIVKILQMGSDNFILRIIYKVFKHKLDYLVYYVGSEDKCQEYLYSFEETVNVDHNSALHHNSESDVLHYILFDSGYYSDSPISIDLTLVQKLTQQSTVETRIKIFKKNSKNKEENESHKLFLKSFECPVCNNFMRPPILQCISGHSVCHDCKPQLKQCPLCRKKFGSTRNYSLESLASHVKFPCQYQDNGCEVALSFPNIDKHDAECEFKPYNCPLDRLGCSWKGFHVNIMPHLKDLHAEKCNFAGFAKGRLNFNENNSETICCIIINADTFRMCGKQNEGDIFWTVEYVGPQSRNKNYMYKLAIWDIENDNRKLVWSDVCQNIDFEEKKDYTVKFPGALFSRFHNKCVMYYCRISQSNTF